MNSIFFFLRVNTEALLLLLFTIIPKYKELVRKLKNIQGITYTIRNNATENCIYLLLKNSIAKSLMLN